MIAMKKDIHCHEHVLLMIAMKVKDMFSLQQLQHGCCLKQLLL